MKRMYTVLAVLALVFLITGCAKVAENAAEKKLAASNGNVKIETNEGKIEATGIDNDEWCKAGAEWKFTSNNPSEQGNVHWVIKGLVSSGEYAGLCHVEYTFSGGDEGQTGKIDYYFTEDGNSGFVEMNSGGQVVKQEWHNTE